MIAFDGEIYHSNAFLLTCQIYSQVLANLETLPRLDSLILDAACIARSQNVEPNDLGRFGVYRLQSHNWFPVLLIYRHSTPSASRRLSVAVFPSLRAMDLILYRFPSRTALGPAS